MRRAPRPLLGAHIVHRVFGRAESKTERTYSDLRIDLWSLLCLSIVISIVAVFLSVPLINIHLAIALVYVYALTLMVLSNGLLQHPSPAS